MKKKSYKYHIISAILLILSLAGILIFWGIHCNKVKKFNETTHEVNGYSLLASSELVTDNEVVLNVYPRGGSSDTWVKEYNSLEHAHHNLVGRIYEMRVDNKSKYQISDWKIKQTIHQSCYINNGWCGTIEVHQFSEDGVEKIQTLNFNDLSVSDVDLDFIISGTDILITLNEGDYLVYYPSKEVNETPIDSINENNPGYILTGIIYYYWDNGMNLSDISLSYNFNQLAKQGPAYDLFIALLSIWFVCLLVITILFISGRRLHEQEKFIDEALTVFTHFIDAKDPYTNGHSNRVAEYSQKLARAMGMTESACRNVYYIALLHDVGKCYISDEILKKPGKLSSSEFEVIKSHTIKGSQMLKDLKSMPDIYNGALYHHERFDGKGYPTGKAGKEIPLIGRIICVADSFDAMNSNRCYRPKLTPEDIIDEIDKNSGTQFDPDIAAVFLKLLKNEIIQFS